MPTTPQKAKKLLKKGKARAFGYDPFVIQLLYATGETKQDIILGVDARSKRIGVSATTQKQELYSAQIELRNDVSTLISTKRQYTRSRRHRKTRYRKARFDNRKRSNGLLAPSIQNKVNAHIKVVDKTHGILPISKKIVEVASFDLQKIKNPDISGVEYQQGELILNLTRNQSYRDATFMGIMRWSLYNTLKQLYNSVELTYGYITKNTRISNNLPKEHRIDAYLHCWKYGRWAFRKIL